MAYQYVVAVIVSLLGFAFLYKRITSGKEKASSSVFGEENCVELTGNVEVDAGNTTDVIIFGSGVAGAALAYTLGKIQDGRRVRVIERDLNEPDRVVGELLQPGGYLKLIELGLEDCVETIDAQRVYGYALFKVGKNAKLSYPLENFRSDVAGRTFHNGRFIQRMRHKAANLPNLEQGSVTSLLEEKGTVKGVQYKTKGGEEFSAYAPLTIVCDGGFSNLRHALCNPKPVASTINTLAGALYKKVFSVSPDAAMEEMREACFVYLSLGGSFSTGPISLLSDIGPHPISLVIHFLSVAIYGVGRWLLPFPSPARIWTGVRLISGVSGIIFPIIRAEGIRQMFFPATVPAYYRAPLVD
ncbi:Squalene epoxidase 2 [Hibiscus syriacus]|uniref:Squalene monooxygenase n=1 Tax=Hibiscus syriacus TaxID=106335 RepID=A0A6A2X1L2_HIBSY|nr:Squalene epoxidase 2 [Hibiscus syriacus]